MRRTGLFAAAAATVTVAVAALLLLVFPGEESARAIVLSAGLALLVQVAAFTILRRMRGALLVGWGLGSLLRLTALTGYALILSRVGELPLTPALVSMAAFLFATMIIEPLLLEQA